VLRFRGLMRFMIAQAFHHCVRTQRARPRKLLFLLILYWNSWPLNSLSVSYIDIGERLANERLQRKKTGGCCCSRPSPPPVEGPSGYPDGRLQDPDRSHPLLLTTAHKPQTDEAKAHQAKRSRYGHGETATFYAEANYQIIVVVVGTGSGVVQEEEY
jgi:hypothetical protein